MLFEVTNLPSPVAHPDIATKVNWWRAEGIPITPFDDAGNKNPYPMMRLIAKNSLNQPIATNDIVLPVSDEMDCRACHASGTQDAAKPASGWVWDGIQERDFRVNILRLHDEKNFAANSNLYSAALAARGFNPMGLYRGVVADNKPVLCAVCHASEALGAPSYGTIPPLTTSIHGFHAHVIDPLSNTKLDDAANRSACYRCHPGSTTKCLRGAMGGAIAADGSMAMQCQSCHGNMSTVGSPARVGWFMEPNCASCHTGTATTNNGQIRYTSVFTDTNFTVRVATNQLFSTQSNTPTAGLSLFRFSTGHGGLQCEACHGSTHAEFPSVHANDNVRNQKIQGHPGMMVECIACHPPMSTSTTTASGGPHGMHPIAGDWISSHHDFISSLTACQACHGKDYQGTVLSRAQADRILIAGFDGGVRVTNNLFRGAMIGCYSCHNGVDTSSPNTNNPPTVTVVSGNTPDDVTLNLPITVTPSTAMLRIISQPANGSLGISNKVLTYFPAAGFVGTDTFTYAAWDGAKNSLLATGSVVVTQGSYSLGISARAPTNYPSGWPVAFAAVPTVTNYSGAVTFDWNFGDGTHSTNQCPTHAFNSAGNYHWSVAATAGSANTSASNNIVITSPVLLSSISSPGSTLALTWPKSAEVIIEQSDSLGPDAKWVTATNLQFISSGVTIPVSDGHRFFRARQPW